MTSALEGKGDPGKADKVRELSKGGWVKMLKRGGGVGGKVCGGHKSWKAPKLQHYDDCQETRRVKRCETVCVLSLRSSITVDMPSGSSKKAD